MEEIEAGDQRTKNKKEITITETRKKLKQKKPASKKNRYQSRYRWNPTVVFVCSAMASLRGLRLGRSRKDDQEANQHPQESGMYVSFTVW